jgi:flagellar protein FliS
MYRNVANTYQQASVLTANPLKLVLMCYEGAIGSLKLACEFYSRKEYEAKAKALQKALDILHELNASLDEKKGGELARNLRSLYNYMIQALIDADLKKNIRVFDDVIKMMEELESGWKAIATVPAEDIGDVESEPQATVPRPVYGGVRQITAGRIWNA